MISGLHKINRHTRIGAGLGIVLAAGIGLGVFSGRVWSEDHRFRSYTQEIFENEVSGNLLNLHYSLAHPEEKGIERPSAVLGTVSPDYEKVYEQCEDYLETLDSFDAEELSEENQLTLDILQLYFETEESLGENYLLEEFLSPSLGIQAQLPVLLAEYAFYEDQDIADYLNLLASIGPYFDSILEFEQTKADAGYFMSDAALDGVLEQCRSFIQNPESNYMLEIFEQKLKDYGKFSEDEQKGLTERHRSILLNRVIPAYQKLIERLEALRGTGKNPAGLAGLDGGRDYYLYLLHTQVGVYDSIGEIQKQLTDQLGEDLKTMSQMVKEQPSLMRKLASGTDLKDFSPEKVLEVLREKSEDDFPALDGAPDYEVRYVHESMEDYLSPAFYLTPPLDTQSPNVIYINRAAKNSNLELFGTLSHEGFPGHLYQTVFFAQTQPEDIRYLITCSGYVEGWATYVETWGYQWAADYLDDRAASDVVNLSRLNRSVTLGICSLLDIGIHYQGWSQTASARFLNAFGITDEDTTSQIFQYIVENPVNYLKYYLGYLNFLQLREEWQAESGDDFNLKDFHRRILEIGPVQFPVLEKYLFSDFSG